MLQRTKVARKAQRIFISNLLQLILASFTSNSHAGVYFPSFRVADDSRIADKQCRGYASLFGTNAGAKTCLLKIRLSASKYEP